MRVDALGDACPIPVVKTKNAIKALGGNGKVEVLVDNEIAVQNLEKMAKQKEYIFSHKKITDGEYQVDIEVQNTMLSPDDEKLMAQPTQTDEIYFKNTVVVIDSEKMGEGDEELGKNLLKMFIYALAQQDIPPMKMIFYNGGAKITTEGSQSLEDLRTLVKAGTKIYTCGACLNFYGLSEKLAVGEVTNMYDIVATLSDANLVIRP